MVTAQNQTWPQGEDLLLEYIYSEGPDENSLVVVDLSTGYEVRMDIVVPATKEKIYTFNSADLADADAITAGSQPDTTKEATLTNGAGGTPNISIRVPRSLTLPPSGAVYAKMTAVTPVSTFNYDVFLRHVASDTQVKIAKGSVTIEESYTLWP